MKKRKRKSLLLAPDDLEIGKYVAVHSIKGTKHTLPFFGQAAQITAINLPFVVAKPVSDNGIATIDLRYLNLMPVSEEYVKAQTPQDRKD
jgi:hypothetical protein